MNITRFLYMAMSAAIYAAILLLAWLVSDWLYNKPVAWCLYALVLIIVQCIVAICVIEIDEEKKEKKPQGPQYEHDKWSDWLASFDDESDDLIKLDAASVAKAWKAARKIK